MKKITLFLLGLTWGIAPVMAEPVDAVYFNPARLGKYEMLKVSHKLVSPGGVTANTMSIQTRPIDNGGVTITNTGGYTVYDSVRAQGSVEMPDSTFNVTNVEALHDGIASFTSTASNKNSVIQNLQNPSGETNIIRMHANSFNTSGSLLVTGPESSDGTFVDYSGNNELKGLTLAAIQVPMVNCNDSNGFQWFGRTATGSDGVESDYLVLGCKTIDCSNPTSYRETKSCSNVTGTNGDTFSIPSYKEASSWSTVLCKWIWTGLEQCRTQNNFWRTMNANYTSQLCYSAYNNSSARKIFVDRPQSGTWCSSGWGSDYEYYAYYYASNQASACSSANNCPCAYLKCSKD